MHNIQARLRCYSIHVTSHIILLLQVNNAEIMAASAAVTPEEVSRRVVEQIQCVLAEKDCEIRNSKFCDDQWRSLACIPNLVRSADAVVDYSSQNAYLRQAKSDPVKIYHLQTSTDEWEQPITINFGILRCSMIYYKEVIMVGGIDKATSQCTNGLIGVRFNDDRTLRPECIFPDMPTRRCRTTALVHTDPQSGASYIIVIGGEDDNEATLTTVEILEPNGQWCHAKDIPEALSGSSGTIVNGYLYLLGGWSKREHPTSSVYRCKVDKLIESRQLAIPFQATTPVGEDVWEKLPDLPVQIATCTSFHDDLIVVGGRANTIPVSDIRRYNEQYKRWEVIGYLPHPRYNCFAIGLPDKLIVIGGKKNNTTSEDSIEIFKCQHHQ